MDLQEEPNVVWLYVKDLSTNKRSILSSIHIWEIEQVKKKQWKRVEFQPKNAEEFHQRKAAEKESTSPKEYGVHEGKYMYRYCLMNASGRSL